jgi:hypothetical protein
LTRQDVRFETWLGEGKFVIKGLMKFAWTAERVPLKFLLADRRLFAARLQLQTCSIGLIDCPPVGTLDLSDIPAQQLDPEFAGFLIRRLPIAQELPTLGWFSGFFCYVPTQDPRYYIDLRQSFEQYQLKSSAKTRATIRRKIRKFAEFSGGSIQWKVYITPDDALHFSDLVCNLSRKTYQHRRLDAGFPQSVDFLNNMCNLANENRFRGYILFHVDRPVAYLYCPINAGVLEYQYLGYDPAFRQWSVGTILFWHALGNIHGEGCFKMFDFAGGQTDQIRQFATHSTKSANVYILRKTIRNIFLVQAHHGISMFSSKSGHVLKKLGLKGDARKLIRFGSLRPSPLAD